VTKPVTWSPSAQAALERLQGKLFATVPETALVLRYDARTLRRAIEAGEIPAVKAGNTYRIPTAWVFGQARQGAEGDAGAA
jgi:excisionase family DNA binding protein